MLFFLSLYTISPGTNKLNANEKNEEKQNISETNNNDNYQ